MSAPTDATPNGFYRSKRGRLLPVVGEVSAGGLVVDRVENEICAAVISRRNRGGRLEWCLPKGHLEQGETPALAAAREIREETGIEGRVICYLSTMDYWFSGIDRRVHKVVHHYLLERLGGELSVEGDPDHEAEQVAWVPLRDLAARLAFPNEKRIARIALELLEGRK